ncbi:MAG: T9SS type A sorting domain-containing protein, partial [Salinivirgaceae bacterium]|nr:T9SS type A sorting domain-containing protein [Salinivirgaceae bacterium]
PTQLIYSENVKVYPNPAATSINITMPPNCSSAELYISNIMGQRIFQQTINSDNVADLDISKLPTGVYILTIEGMKNKYYSKFIKR